MRQKGLFIVVDGPSASGKDTIIKHLLKDLADLKIKVFAIEETKEKNYDRQKILAAKERGDKAVSRTIINERRKLYQAKIIPQLKSGVLIIANRGEPTTLAYQTINQELTMDNIWKIHRQQQIPLPDLIVLISCSVEEAIRREESRSSSLEKKDKNIMSGKFTSARKKIHANYKIVKKFLEKKGLTVIYLETDTINIGKVSQKIVNFIKNKVN